MSASDKCKDTIGHNGKLEWSHCAVCGGRRHEDDCKTKRIAGRDCPGEETHSEAEMKAAGY